MESKLKKRLDALDKELQLLHARVASRRPVFSDAEPSRKVLYLKEPSTLKKNVKFNKCHITGEPNKNELPYKGSLHLEDDCKKFLQKISKSIAKGSEAIHKIASLTEVSSFSGADGDKNSLSVISKINSIPRISNASALNKDNSGMKKKSILVANNRSNNQKCTKPQRDSFLCEVDKIIESLQFSRKQYDAPSTPPTKDSGSISESLAFEKTMEFNMEALNHLRDKVANLKTKLKKEQSKRENAEKAICGYRRRLEALEGKKKHGRDYNQNKETVILTNPSETTKEHEVSKCPSKRENAAHQTGERDAKEVIKELKEALEKNKQEIESLKNSKEWALKMAETFRGNICQHDTQELEKLRAENCYLHKQVTHLEETVEAKPALIDTLLERAERAEKELIEKMKECNNLMARSSVNDPEVQELLERHRSAYRELQHEKKHKEAELKKQMVSLKKEFETILSKSDKKYKEIYEKYSLMYKDLEKKECDLQDLLSSKSNFEKEIINLKARLLSSTQLCEHQDVIIKELNEKLKIGNEEFDKLKSEYEENKSLLRASIDSRVKELSEQIIEKEKMISSLSEEVEKHKDAVNIKDKMLKDQSDTIKCLRTVSDNTKKMLDNERAQKQKLANDVTKLQLSNEIIQNKLINYEKRLNEEESSFASLQQTSRNNLKEIEAQELKRQKELEKQLSQMSHERDQAVQTARFATEKMVLAINEYETKLSVQRRFYTLLTEAYKEKEMELEIANKQLNELSEELWRCNKKAEAMKFELHSHLWKACEVCTDVISAQVEKDL